ncbi:hypothetical protein NBRC10513v2_001326 [Rhodotorula toruloides]
MLSKTLIALTAFSTVALASPSPGVGVNVVKTAAFTEAEKAAKVSLKEICYRNLYADVAKYKVKYAKEVLAKDAKGKAVFLFDGIKKDINNREFYYEEFCYKQFNIAEHNADVAKQNTAVVGGAAGLGGGYGGAGLKGEAGYKRDGILGGGLDGGMFNKGAFLDGWSSIDAFDGGKGLGLGALASSSRLLCADSRSTSQATAADTVADTVADTAAKVSVRYSFSCLCPRQR